MKKLFIFILTVLMTLNIICPLPTFANTNSTEKIEYDFYEDGSYMITRITNESTAIAARASTTTTKSKISSYYSSANKELWYVKVTGTFRYDGKSATCTNSNVSATSYDSNWKISNRASSKSGASATAKATGKFYVNSTVKKTINKSVTLTCSANGTFS